MVKVVAAADKLGATPIASAWFTYGHPAHDPAVVLNPQLTPRLEAF